MSIKQITDQKKWDSFVQSQPIYTFFQSWNWGKFQQQQNRKIWRIAVEDQNQLIGGGFCYKIEAKRGNFLVFPHGPFLNWKNKNLVKKFFSRLRKLGKKQGAWFIRSGIPKRDNKKLAKKLATYKLRQRPAPTSYSAENFWVLDTSPDKEKLLSEMKKGHRYSVRKAKREGAEIEKIGKKSPKAEQKKALKKFYKIYEKTVAREDFSGFSYQYIKNEYESFVENDQCLIIQAKYKNEVIASALIIYYGNEGGYHQGASLRKYKKVPASQLLQWHAILEAKKRNCDRYNFWGIAPPDATEDHPWHGLTYFKKGFGGKRLDFIPAHDLKLSWKYNFTRLVEKWQQKRRNL